MPNIVAKFWQDLGKVVIYYHYMVYVPGKTNLRSDHYYISRVAFLAFNISQIVYF